MPKTIPPYSGKASLSEAFERVTRAGEHLEELKRTIGPLKFELKSTQEQKGQGIQLNMLVYDKPTIPPRVGVIIGEICYNLRAALDYLVSNLSALDSGLDHPGTQFPIEDRPKDFMWRVKERRLLGGMNLSHRTKIEGLQPYKGNKWAKTLKEISNPDKHRNLIAVGVQGRPVGRTEHGPIGNLGATSGTVVSTIFDSGTEMHTDINVTTLVQFSDGTPVVEALEEIKAQVSQVLDAFKPIFD